MNLSSQHPFGLEEILNAFPEVMALYPERSSKVSRTFSFGGGITDAVLIANPYAGAMTIQAKVQGREVFRDQAPGRANR
jgi:hypothetical protein